MRFYLDNDNLVAYDNHMSRFRLFKVNDNLAAMISGKALADIPYAKECCREEFSRFCENINCCNSVDILNIDWLLTSRCNLNCVYCYADDIKGSLSFDKAYDICDTINNSSVLHLTLSGGEPMLFPDIDRIIRRIDSDISITIDTNGTFPEIIRKHARLFRDRDIIFRITIDSIDNMVLSSLRPSRTKEDYFQKIDETISFLIENNINVMVHSVVSQTNKDRLSFLADYLLEKRIYRWNLNKVLVVGDCDTDGIEISDEDFVFVTNEIIKSYGEKIDIEASYTVFTRSVLIITPSGDMYTHDYLNGQRIQIESDCIQKNTIFDYLDKKNHYLEYFRHYKG